MQRNKATTELLDSIIIKIRSFHGDAVIPEVIQAQELYTLITTVQNHRKSLKRSGSDMGLYEVAQRVCEARLFTLDTIHNTVLARAYHIAVMNYFGKKRIEYARREKYVRNSLVSQRRSAYGRE